TVTLSTSGGGSCTGSGLATITDIARPVPVILEPGDTICETEGYILTVSDQSGVSGSVSARWYVVGESSSVGSGSELVVGSSGLYYAEMIHRACPRFSDTVSVVADRPVKAVVQPREQYIEEGEVVSVN